MKRKTKVNPKSLANLRPPFPKGTTGNPGGRKKLPEDQKKARAQAQAILDAHTPEAAWKLVEQMNDTSDPVASERARREILDRGGFTGPQRLELSGKDGQAIPPIQNNTQNVLYVDDPASAIRILNVLASRGALPVGVAELEADDEPQVDEVHPAAPDGKADSVPPR